MASLHLATARAPRTPNCAGPLAAHSDDDGGREVVLLADGSPVVVGTFSETATLDPGAPGQTQRTTVGTQEDVFVVKYDPDGRP